MTIDDDLTADAMTDGARRQQRLIDVLACPSCHGALALVRATERRGTVVDADLHCPACGEVGAIRSYRPTFHPHELGHAYLPAGVAEAPLTQIEVIGTWVEQPLGRLGLEIGACLTGVTEAEGIVFTLGTHDWGATGLASFGSTERRVDQYSRVRGSTRVVLHEPERPGQTKRWSFLISPGTQWPDRSERTQALVHDVAALVPAADAPPLAHRPSNRGNPYPARFAALLADLPGDAVVLDLGGGDRCHPDPRVLNFEYMRFENADFFGDGLHLPIADDSVDLILSQAVLEHVPEPQRAVGEMLRVLRPGGTVYTEIAFMQPLHAVPFHYFNVTPHGAALLFERWDVRQSGVFGGLGDTMRWFFDLLDANRRLGAERAVSVIDALGELDRQLGPGELEYVASAVFVEAVKPG